MSPYWSHTKDVTSAFVATRSHHERFSGTVQKAHHCIRLPSTGSFLGTELFLLRWGTSPWLALMQWTYIAYRDHLTYMTDPAAFGACHECQKKPTDKNQSRPWRSQSLFAQVISVSVPVPKWQTTITALIIRPVSLHLHHLLQNVGVE